MRTKSGACALCLVLAGAPFAARAGDEDRNIAYPRVTPAMPPATNPPTSTNSPSTCISDSMFFDGFEQPQQLEVTGAGVGSSDNYTLWIAGSGFANNSHVDLRVPGSSTILQSYAGCARTLTNRNGVSVITFRVTDSSQQSYLDTSGLNLWVVNSGSTFAGPILVKRTTASTTTLTISGAGVGGPDDLSVYVVGTLFDSDAYVDARSAGARNVLESYGGSLRTNDAEYGLDILTFQVADSVQQSVLSRGGLYLWVVNPGGSFTGPIIAQRARAQLKGGSNYNWYHVDFTGTDCNREPYGIVKNYHQAGVRSTVRSQLAMMAAGGQRRLRVALYFSDAGSTATIVQTPNGVFPAQYLTNLQNYLADIKAAGYQEVEIGMFPLGSYSFWTAPSFSQTIADQYWNLIQQAQNVVTDSGVRYLFDLGNELMPPVGASPAWSSYITSLWGHYVATYGSSYTVGFSASDESRIANMAIYGATPPSVVDLHVYGNPSTEYTTADNYLTSQNLPNVDIVIAETLYNDSAYASGIRSSVNASNSGRWMRWLTEWPRSLSGLQTANCTGQNVQSPLDDSVYLQQGF